MTTRISIVYVLLHNIDLDVIEEGKKKFCSTHEIDVDLNVYLSPNVDNDPLIYSDLVEKTRTADYLIIRDVFMPDRFKKLNDFEKKLTNYKGLMYVHAPSPDLIDFYRKYYKGSDEDMIKFNLLMKNTSSDNESEIIKMITNEIGLTDEEVILPPAASVDGIYHPRWGKCNEPEKYFKTLDPNKITIGILFRSYIYDNYSPEHMDYLIKTLEIYGNQTIPVFFPAKSRKGTGCENSEYTVKKYFMNGNKSRVDTILVITPFSMIVNSVDEPGITSDPELNFFKNLTNVPVIQAMMAWNDYADYSDMRAGIEGKNVANYVAWPEIDGQIISVPIALSKRLDGESNTITAIPDRIDHICRLATNWAILKHTKPSERKIAILLYQKRFDNGRLGSAAGLDSFESLYRILKRLKNEGYDVGTIPKNSRELLDCLLSGVTNDFSNQTDDFIYKNAAAHMSKEPYDERFKTFETFNQDNIKEYWNDSPGNICVSKNKFIIPGKIFGNVLVSMQPARASEENAEKLYHDPILPPTHQYVAFYQWIRDDFKANAVVHLGTHGSLEWLPGKNTGLSRGCYPDLVLDALPNVNPYIIDNPGEGVQAKRRSEAVLIGYAASTMIRSDLYDELELLDSTIRQYINESSAMPNIDHSELLNSIKELLRDSSLNEELNIHLDDEGFDSKIPEIMDYLEEIKDTLIPNGLHVFGKIPDKEETENIVCSCVRVKGKCCDSLREAVQEFTGLNDTGDDLDVLDSICRDLIVSLSNNNYDVNSIKDTIISKLNSYDEKIAKILNFVCTSLVPNIKKTDNEMQSLIDSLNGEFVLPGPPGAVSRGDAQALPTGRNMYGIDPEVIPTLTSWNNGVKMANTMLEKYVFENGRYPHDIGFIIWATDTMKTGGDDVAYILWLMGVRPKWKNNGHIDTLEVIPIRELGRPRIDISIRITGLFRDTFPNLIELFNKAVALVADLDEEDEENYLKANLRKEIEEQIFNGLEDKEAREMSMIRVFGGRYGCYGSGVNHAIENRNWETVDDLSKMYVTWGGCGFKSDGREIRMENTFIKKLSKVDLGIKNMPDRQMDVFTGDDVYGYLGGLGALVKSTSGKKIPLYIGDGSNPNKPKVRTSNEECGHVVRSKILNDKYLNGLKKHGFQGVTELARASEYMIGWDATSDSIDDWIFKEFTEKIILNENNREWMKESNPYSLMEIIQNMNEAIDRGLWNADDEIIDRLKNVFLEIEETLEEFTDQ